MTIETIFLCCADGEGSHEFKVCADKAAVSKFYESMFGRDMDDTLDSFDQSWDDKDNWRNDGTAFEIELYCATFKVWKVTPDEVQFARPGEWLIPGIKWALTKQHDGAVDVIHLHSKLTELEKP